MRPLSNLTFGNFSSFSMRPNYRTYDSKDGLEPRCAMRVKAPAGSALNPVEPGRFAVAQTWATVTSRGLPFRLAASFDGEPKIFSPPIDGDSR